VTAVYRKGGSPALPRQYAAEAAGLAWLAAAGPRAARVVEVIDVGEHHLTLERLTPAPPDRAAAADVGRRLAATHAAGATAFGAPPDGWSGSGYIGPLVLAMEPTATWGGFYAEQRVRPYARAAYDRATLSGAGLAAVERVCERLLGGAFDDDRPPARIHGDLWSGNLVYSTRGGVLIDPAAHGGHGLTDLAMLALFGTPHLATLQAAYAEAADLAPGWNELIGLHQLHPLLVHAVLFGGAYGAEAEQVARHYG
jgi:fructosamine-3-kinase